MRACFGELDESTTMVRIESLLPADSPRIDGENLEYIKILAAQESGLPPIVVHGATMRVVDGMHRLRAAILRGQHSIEARFVAGELRDLFVIAVKLNSRNGLPLSLRERTAAAQRMIKSHPHWSDRAIAHVTGLSAGTIAATRRRSTGQNLQLNSRLGRDGKVRRLTTVDGRLLTGRLMLERPEASIREIAREAGVSVGTAHDVRRRLQRGEDPAPSRQSRAGPLPAEPPSPEPAGLPLALTRDPSLRFSENGRMILRLMGIHSITSATWNRLSGAVPAHCAEAVADIARKCAAAWQQFAEQVEKRNSVTKCE
jgi:AraC-like DNA-binding protein